MNEFGPTGPSPTALLLLKVADSPDLLEVGRKAIENCLVEYRNARISEIRSNGLVIRESDGTPNGIVFVRNEPTWTITSTPDPEPRA